jgi:hypothetical protein
MSIETLYEDLGRSFDLLGEAVKAEKDLRTGYWRVEIHGHGALTRDDKFYGTKANAIKLAREKFAKGKFYIVPYSGGTGRYDKAGSVDGKAYRTRAQADRAMDRIVSKRDLHIDDLVVRWLE